MPTTAFVASWIQINPFWHNNLSIRDGKHKPLVEGHKECRVHRAAKTHVNTGYFLDFAFQYSFIASKCRRFSGAAKARRMASRAVIQKIAIKNAITVERTTMTVRGGNDFLSGGTAASTV